MSDLDLARRIELERADAQRTLAQRVIDALKKDNVNTTYQAAYARAIKKLKDFLK